MCRSFSSISGIARLALDKPVVFIMVVAAELLSEAEAAAMNLIFSSIIGFPIIP